MAMIAVAAPATVAMLSAAVLVLTLRRRRGFRRHLLSMGAAAQHPSRRLVEVLRPVRASRTGQLLYVIDARSGQEAVVWLSVACRLRSGDLALLVWMSGRWMVMDRHPARLGPWPSVFAHPHRATSKRTLSPSGWRLREGDVVSEAERYLGR